MNPEIVALIKKLLEEEEKKSGGVSAPMTTTSPNTMPTDTPVTTKEIAPATTPMNTGVEAVDSAVNAFQQPSSLLSGATGLLDLGKSFVNEKADQGLVDNASQYAEYLNEDEKALLRMKDGGKIPIFNDGGSLRNKVGVSTEETELTKAREKVGTIPEEQVAEQEVPKGLEGLKNALQSLGKSVQVKATENIQNKQETDNALKGKEIPQTERKDTGEIVNRGLTGEAVLNTGLGVVNTLRANEAAKRLRNLQRPKPTFSATATPANFEAGQLEKAQEGIDEQAEATRRRLQANTGDLRTLMAGLSNVNAQTQSTKRGLSESAMSQYNQDRQRYIQEQRQNALQQDNINNQFNEQNFQEERGELRAGQQRANEAFASNTQNLLGIAKNRRDLAVARGNEIRQAELFVKKGLQDYINEQKQKQGVGDKYFAASKEDQLKMEQQWTQEYNQIAEKYKGIVNTKNPFATSIFSRKKKPQQENELKRGGRVKRKTSGMINTEELISAIRRNKEDNISKELQTLRQIFNSSQMPYSVFLSNKSRR